MALDLDQACDTSMLAQSGDEGDQDVHLAALVSTGPKVALLPAHDGLEEVKAVNENEEIFPRCSEVKQAVEGGGFGAKGCQGPPTLHSIGGKKAPFRSKTAPAPMRSEDRSTLPSVAATVPCQ